MESGTGFNINCPIPDEGRSSHVRMAHGSGGSLMRRLIEEVFLAAFGGDRPPPLNDSAVLSLPPGRLAPCSSPVEI